MGSLFLETRLLIMQSTSIYHMFERTIAKYFERVRGFVGPYVGLGQTPVHFSPVPLGQVGIFYSPVSLVFQVLFLQDCFYDPNLTILSPA